MKNIKDSPYIIQIDNAAFYFSSKYFQEKYIKSLNIYYNDVYNEHKDIIGKISNMSERQILFGIMINHYRSIEKKGFYIVVDNKSFHNFEELENLAIEDFGEGDN